MNCLRMLIPVTLAVSCSIAVAACAETTDEPDQSTTSALRNVDDKRDDRKKDDDKRDDRKKDDDKRDGRKKDDKRDDDKKDDRRDDDRRGGKTW